MLYYVLEAVVIIAVCVAGCFFAFSNYKKNVETTIGNAEDKAREIVDEALKTAETKNARDFLRLRRNPLRPRMSLIRKSRSAGRKHSAMRDVFSRKRRALTRRRKRLKRKKPSLLHGKKSLQNNRQLLQD